MEKQKQSWVMELTGLKWFIVKGDYEISVEQIEKLGIRFWVRQIKEKNPSFDWMEFEKVICKFLKDEKVERDYFNNLVENYERN